MKMPNITDELRATVRAELPEIEEISDPDLRDKVVEAWAFALAETSFRSISEIPGAGAPGRNVLKTGTQADHLRGVAIQCIRVADEFKTQFPDFPLKCDILIAGALVHDVGKPWEFAPENQTRWEDDPRETGWPSIRHPPYGAHVCLSVGLPEAVAHIATAHSREGEAILRSLECTIVYYVDHAYWRILKAGGMLADTEAVRPPAPPP
ncbi:MAG: HD domain-containing protein [Rhodospirillales bacterium]|jgi:23S rRNA maturation-related 3'-5' exoribonuclease YhaM|nr:HD domain-containing protein [Rhodospirillales bacterium]